MFAWRIGAILIAVFSAHRRWYVVFGRRMLLLAVALVVLAELPLPAKENRSSDGLWREVGQSSVPQLDAPKTRAVRRWPRSYRVLAVKEELLRELLAQAPMEFVKGPEAPVVMTIPLPDGTYDRFGIEESPILPWELQAKFPEIRTYVARGIDDATATARLDRTPAGFHAMILSARGTVYVDPYQRGDTVHYISYWKHDMIRDSRDFRCLVEAFGARGGGPVPAAPSGSNLRSYRLAMAATSQYTAFQGGTVAQALAAITTTVNRVTGIYEREVAIRMVLVGNETSIIYTTEPDPYTNGNVPAMTGENQTNLDAVIQDANYDVGHVMGTVAVGSSGLACLNCVCLAGNKARAATASAAPVGDAFDVDYVAHEIGHQFGGNHTFNGTTGSCGSASQRVSTAAYEPGSGSTIMAYAGICPAGNPTGGENVQPNTDDYFHTFSFDEITAFRDAGGACGTQSATGNTPPTVNAGSDFSIPTDTPFTLTATGSDSDGDTLTYTWEQFDLGTASPPPNNADGPLFRSRRGTTNSSRTFPQLADILSGAATPWEILPTVNRSLNFRVTARDNRAGGGGVNYDSAVVTVEGAPFRITVPNGGETLNCGCSASVMWDVGGGSVAPTVHILLSLDGGNTFPTVLAANTPNDGVETVTVPCTPGSQARVRIEPVSNIFFDISNNNFALQSVAPSAVVNAVGGSVDAVCQRSVTFSATVTDDCRVDATDVSTNAALLTGNATLGLPTITEVQTNSTTVDITGNVLVSNLTSSPATVQVQVSGTDRCGNLVSEAAVANVVDATAPAIACPVSTTVECTATGGTPASDPQLEPFFTGVSATDNCDSSPNLANNAPSFFNLGPTSVTFTAMDASGNTNSCSSTVTVEDTTSPTLSFALFPDVLWPPNHKLVEITANIQRSDICDPNPMVMLVSITSNEPDNGLGDGDTPDDIQGAAFGTDDRSFFLRAERSGKGSGRIYTVTYQVTDASGNHILATGQVRVPRNRR